MYKHLTPQEIEEFEEKFLTDFGHGITDWNTEDPDYEDVLSFIDTLIGKRENNLRGTIADLDEELERCWATCSASPKRNEE